VLHSTFPDRYSPGLQLFCALVLKKLYLDDHPPGTGCWLGDPNNVNGRAWFSGDPKIITKCENYGLNPVKLALALTEALFTREEMAASNVRGTRGKESLDPSKIKAIRGNDVNFGYVYIGWNFPPL
jgi:hypothetical protein